MIDDAMLSFLKRLANGIAQQFGEQCEVVVHDFDEKNTEHTIVAIENGHVSRRSVGDGPSRPVLAALVREGGAISDHVNYLTRTQDGRILKSSTIYLRDARGKATGIFAINYDITNLLLLESAIKPLVTSQQNEEGKEPERIVQNVNDLLEELMEQSVALVGKPVALMTKDDKIKAIQFLNETGAFLITKSGDKVSKYFQISKYTLYNYIDAKQ